MKEDSLRKTGRVTDLGEEYSVYLTDSDDLAKSEANKK